MMATFTDLLREPRSVAERCRSARDLRDVLLVGMTAIACGGASYGAAMGSLRGGEQIAYAAIKVPLVLLGTLAVCVPAFHALTGALGRPWPLRSVAALTLAAAARASLVLLALAPVLWLGMSVLGGYHASVLASAAVYAAAGAAALSVLRHGLGDGDGQVTTLLCIGLVFCMVGSQSAWVMRPFLLRPRATSVPFIRAPEGSFVDSLVKTGTSAFGIYEDARDERDSTDDRTLAPPSTYQGRRAPYPSAR